MPRPIRALSGMLGGGLLVLAIYALFTAHPWSGLPLLAEINLTVLAANFLTGAVTARWPMLTGWFLP